MSRREIFLERWTVHALAASLNYDSAILAELSPHWKSSGKLDGLNFLLTDSGESILLTPEERDLVERCDGKTPVHQLRAPVEQIRRLIERQVLECKVEVPALEPHAFSVLCRQIESWRESETRRRWRSIVQPFEGLLRKFGETNDTTGRREIVSETRARLEALGASRQPGDRSLYSAINPIGEECLRDCDFRVTQSFLEEPVVEAAGWVDLWRDSYAYVASRVAAGLRRILAQMPSRDGSVPLPAFLGACESAKLALTGPGLVGMAVVAFQEIKAALRERLQPHAGQEEYALTTEDCHVVRKNFDYPKFDEYTYPAADLQLAAASPEAVAQGAYQWILAELHPPIALLHHCMYWGCPNKPALHEACARTAFAKPNFHFGFFAADFTAHTSVHLFDALAELSNFVAPQIGNSKWRTVRPADAEVYVEDSSGDVCVRKVGSHEPLGSFARAWLIPLGFHPFQFGLAPHTPRLRCGKVIVQRRTWTIRAEEIPPGNYTGVSRDLLVAIERLRATRGWPRYVYIRPTEQALRRSGAEGRDKDTKPVFIDLESYLFLEIFHRWLNKAGELEITEMLPTPDQLLWREPDGRRTFELRTLVVPRG